MRTGACTTDPDSVENTYGIGLRAYGELEAITKHIEIVASEGLHACLC